MPAFDVTIEGKTYHVEIPDPGASPLQVIVDGQPFEVDIAGTEIEAAPAKLAPAAPSRRRAGAAAAAPAHRRRHSRPRHRRANGGSEIIAPMPGTILSVDVNVGPGGRAGQVCASSKP